MDRNHVKPADTARFVHEVQDVSTHSEVIRVDGPLSLPTSAAAGEHTEYRETEKKPDEHVAQRPSLSNTPNCHIKNISVSVVSRTRK